MQTVAIKDVRPTITGKQHYKQPIVALRLVPVPAGNKGANIKQLYLKKQMFFASSKHNPRSFMDCCEAIYNEGKTFKSAMDSWKSRNGSKAWFFIMEREEI